MPSSLFSKESLKKLTVPQLKNLCKETNVVGYSKLNKDAIIAKFLAHQNTKDTETVLTPQPPHSATKNIVSGATALNEARAKSVTASESLELEPFAAPSSQLILQSTSANSNLQNVASHTIETRAPEKDPGAWLSRRLDPSAEIIETPRRKNPIPSLPGKRAAIIDLPQTKSPKKAKFGSNSEIGEPEKGFLAAATRTETEPSTSNMDTIVTGNHNSTTPAIFPRVPRNNAHVLPEGFRSSKFSLTQNHLSKENTQESMKPAEFSRKGLGPAPAHAPAPNRYKRLVPINPSITPPFPLNVPATSTMKTPSVDKKNLNHMQLAYLEFPAEQAVSLHAITFPPSVFQRKHVPRLSLILSGLSFEDLRACSLVSRAFRYSGKYNFLVKRMSSRRKEFL